MTDELTSLLEFCCKICGSKAKAVFNIQLKRVPICETCATSITLQQVQWVMNKSLRDEIEQK